MSIHIPSHIKTSLLLFGLVLLVFAPITYVHSYVITADDLTDFHLHKLYAISLAENGPASIPSTGLAHSGWQFLLIFFHKLFGVSFEFAGLLAALLSYELTAFVLFFWYRPALRKTGRSDWQSWPVVFGVCIAAPVSLLWPLDRLMYLGYIGITSYHNPTIILLKPFAILQFIFAYLCFRETGLVKKWQIILSALISSLCAFIKPNLAICLLPALVIFSAYRILKKEYLNYKALFWGLGLPTVIVLVWQFALTYYAKKNGAVAFLPFVVMSTYSQYLGWKLLLSILFPLAVLLVYFKQAIKDPRMILAWLIFLVALIFTYFFAESGERLLHGNFVWSGEIASILLFAVSTLFYFEGLMKTTKLAKTLTTLWLVHVAFGVLYYLSCIFSGTYY